MLEACVACWSSAGGMRNQVVRFGSLFDSIGIRRLLIEHVLELEAAASIRGVWLRHVDVSSLRGNCSTPEVNVSTEGRTIDSQVVEQLNSEGDTSISEPEQMNLGGRRFDLPRGPGRNIVLG
eukprot:4143746-Alexandrium_andersonii.AAC.1